MEMDGSAVKLDSKKQKLNKEEIFELVNKNTLEFINRGRLGELKLPSEYVFEKHGFKIYLRYVDDKFDYFTDCDLERIGVERISDCIVIAGVVNKRYRKQGWFWKYVDFLRSNVTGGVVIESVGLILFNALSKRTNEGYKAIKTRSFYIESY